MAAKSIPAEGSEQQSAVSVPEANPGTLPELNEDQALALLQRSEVTAETLVSWPGIQAPRRAARLRLA